LDVGHYFTRFARAVERGWATVTPDGIRLDERFSFEDE
jgi:hypothetical protein